MLNNENYGYLVHPLSQFMDDNLKPLTSAYLKVFYAGTSSSAYTYSDWEGTLNTSNIILSMNGSANVIAEKNKAYKVMLCDALHPPSSPIWVKDNLYVISSEIEIEVINSTQIEEYIDNKISSAVQNLQTKIKDNAYDSVTNPTHPDNITDINELRFFRNQDSGANYPILSSEERQYGILLPAPVLEAGQGKVPVYKVGDQIVWEHVLNEAPDDGLSYARTSKAWNVIGSSIDITDDFELIDGMSTNNVGNVGRFRVIYVPSTDMVQIRGNFFNSLIKPYDSWAPCMRYTGDYLSFNSINGGQMNVGLGGPSDNYNSVRAIVVSAFIDNPNYTERIFAFKALIGNNNLSVYGVSSLFTCYGCRNAKLAEIAAAELANSGE